MDSSIGGLQYSKLGDGQHLRDPYNGHSLARYWQLLTGVKLSQQQLEPWPQLLLELLSLGFGAFFGLYRITEC